MAVKTKKKPKATNQGSGTQVKTKKSETSEIVVAEKAAVEKVKKVPEKTTEKKLQKKTEKSPGLFSRLVNFIKSVTTELKKVNWLTKEELTKSSSIVFGIVGIFTVLVWIADSGLTLIQMFLVNLKL